MKDYIVRQANRPLQDLAIDTFAFGMLAFCVVGGWIL